MKRPLKFQYFYKHGDCKAFDASKPDCICWHNEGEGPRKDERHTSKAPLVEWRIKPYNTEGQRAA